MHNKRRISRLPDVSCIFIVTVNTAHTVIKVNARIMISRILNMPFLIDANDLRTIKRIEDKGDMIILKLDNKEYNSQTIPKNKLSKVFQVIGSIKKF